ncbi:hypothetical protein BRADI_4g27427v3, partial [Brachypodium distachyon]
KNFHLQSHTCVLCSQQQLETRNHIFFHCQFARMCWGYICLMFKSQNSVHDNIMVIKQEHKLPFHMGITMLVSWSIWKTRNDCIFNGITPSIYGCKRIFKDELNLVFHRAKRKDYNGFKAWIDKFR